jgi:chromosome segregation ATPase
MKKILSFLFTSLVLISCGNNSEMKGDVKKLVELKCKMKQSFDKIMDINKQIQSIPQPNYSDITSVQKYSDEQKKFMDELKEVKKLDNELLDEYRKLEKEFKEKYNSESDKKDLKKEFSLQLTTSGCE